MHFQNCGGILRCNINVEHVVFCRATNCAGASTHRFIEWSRQDVGIYKLLRHLMLSPWDFAPWHSILDPGSQSHGLPGQMLGVLIQSWALVGCHSDGHCRPNSDWRLPNLGQQLPQLNEANQVKGCNGSVLSYSTSNSRLYLYVVLLACNEMRRWSMAGLCIIEHHKCHDDDLLHLLTSSVNLYTSSFDMVLKSDTPNLKWILIQHDVVSEVILNVHFSKEISGTPVDGEQPIPEVPQERVIAWSDTKHKGNNSNRLSRIKRHVNGLFKNVIKWNAHHMKWFKFPNQKDGSQSI